MWLTFEVTVSKCLPFLSWPPQMGLSLASHISETSEAIAITFDRVTVLSHENASRIVFGERSWGDPVRLTGQAFNKSINKSIKSFLGHLGFSNWTICKDTPITDWCEWAWHSAQDPQRHVDLYKLNCVGVFQEAMWRDCYHSHLVRQRPGFNPRLI